MLVYLGLFLFFKDFLFLLVFLFSIPLMYIQAKSEEKLLIKVFGEEYKGYQLASGMFLPLVSKQWTGKMLTAILRKRTKVVKLPRD